MQYYNLVKKKSNDRLKCVLLNKITTAFMVDKQILVARETQCKTCHCQVTGNPKVKL